MIPSWGIKGAAGPGTRGATLRSTAPLKCLVLFRGSGSLPAGANLKNGAPKKNEFC